MFVSKGIPLNDWSLGLSIHLVQEYFIQEQGQSCTGASVPETSYEFLCVVHGYRTRYSYFA